MQRRQSMRESSTQCCSNMQVLDAPHVLLEVVALRPDEPRMRLSVPKDRLHGVLPKGLQQVTLVTGPGALGWAWLAYDQRSPDAVACQRGKKIAQSRTRRRSQVKLPTREGSPTTSESVRLAKACSRRWASIPRTPRRSRWRSSASSWTGTSGTNTAAAATARSRRLRVRCA